MEFLKLTTEVDDVVEPGRLARIWASVVWFITESDYQFAEVLAVTVNILWLIALWGPDDYLNQTPALAALQHVIGQSLMISACLATLIAPIVAIVTGSVVARRAALLGYIAFYAGLWAGISAASATAVTAGLSALVCLAAVWGYLRLGGKHR